MSLSAFFAENIIQTENQKVVVSKRIIDPKTKQPIEWEIKGITSDEDENLRKQCTRQVPMAGQKGRFTVETDYDKYLGLLASKCTVFPDLNNAELQDSYKVKNPDLLLKKMLNAGEYANFMAKIQAINGFDVAFDELVDEAKN